MKTNHQRNFKQKYQAVKDFYLKEHKDEFADKAFFAFFAFTAEASQGGARGMAGQVKGVKKYIKSRTRFHGKMKLQKIVKEEI